MSNKHQQRQQSLPPDAEEPQWYREFFDNVLVREYYDPPRQHDFFEQLARGLPVLVKNGTGPVVGTLEGISHGRAHVRGRGFSRLTRPEELTLLVPLPTLHQRRGGKEEREQQHARVANNWVAIAAELGMIEHPHPDVVRDGIATTLWVVDHVGSVGWVRQVLPQKYLWVAWLFDNNGQLRDGNDILHVSDVTDVATQETPVEYT